MKAAWQTFRGWLDRREPATALALMRVLLGLCILHIVVPLVETGAHHLLLVDLSDGGYTRIIGNNTLLDLLGGATRTGVDRLCALNAAAAICVILGLGGRVSIFVALQALIALFSLNPASGGGHDRLLTNGLWLLVLGESTATLSLDARLRHGRWVRDALVAAWPRYLAVFQLVVVYTATGLQKVGVPWTPWGGFSALYRALLMPSWQRWNMDWIGPFFPLTQMGTVGTLIFEVGAPVWLLAAWYRDTRTRPGRLRALFNRLDVRRIWVAAGVALHVGIALFLNVGVFSWVTLSFYVALFHPDEWAAWARRLRAR